MNNTLPLVKLYENQLDQEIKLFFLIELAYNKAINQSTNTPQSGHIQPNIKRRYIAIGRFRHI